MVKTGLRREGEEDFVSHAYKYEQISSVARTMVEDAMVMTTVGDRLLASVLKMHRIFDESGDIYVETNNNRTTTIKPQGTQWKNLDLDPKLYYYRGTLDYYGVLTQYYHPRDTKAKQGWTIMRYVPDNICTAIFNEMGSGTCGYNSYCSMENQRPTCGYQ
ncbi:hypothetical protein MTR_5g013050 [Medicago truncatula]|uniref:Uncharacterized protein n=1 Tax=Medicago truncatula TaxID=3880 RepID=G7JXF2_MEDTR|nr:hypothetical protein MTR_5g013050 [Medicago truncatula]